MVDRRMTSLENPRPRVSALELADPGAAVAVVSTERRPSFVARAGRLAVSRGGTLPAARDCARFRAASLAQFKTYGTRHRSGCANW